MGWGDKQDPRENSVRKRIKTMEFRCTPEEHKLIGEMAAWSGMNRYDYIIAKLADIQVELRPSLSVQNALKDSMAELTNEVSNRRNKEQKKTKQRQRKQRRVDRGER